MGGVIFVICIIVFSVINSASKNKEKQNKAKTRTGTWFPEDKKPSSTNVHFDEYEEMAKVFFPKQGDGQKGTVNPDVKAIFDANRISQKPKRYVSVDLPEMNTFEGVCPPDHQHGSASMEGSSANREVFFSSEGFGTDWTDQQQHEGFGLEGGAPAVPGVSERLHANSQLKSNFAVSNETPENLRLKKRMKQQLLKKRYLRQAVVWSEILKRPRFDVLPKDR